MRTIAPACARHAPVSVGQFRNSQSPSWRASNASKRRMAAMRNPLVRCALFFFMCLRLFLPLLPLCSLLAALFVPLFFETRAHESELLSGRELDARTPDGRPPTGSQPRAPTGDRQRPARRAAVSSRRVLLRPLALAPLLPHPLSVSPMSRLFFFGVGLESAFFMCIGLVYCIVPHVPGQTGRQPGGQAMRCARRWLLAARAT